MHWKEVETKKQQVYLEITNNQIDEVLAQLMSLSRSTTGRSLAQTQRHFTNHHTVRTENSGYEKLLDDSQDDTSLN